MLRAIIILTKDKEIHALVGEVIKYLKEKENEQKKRIS